MNIVTNKNFIIGICFVFYMAVKGFGMYLCSRKDVSNKKAKFISNIAMSSISRLVQFISNFSK